MPSFRLAFASNGPNGIRYKTILLILLSTKYAYLACRMHRRVTICQDKTPSDLFKLKKCPNKVPGGFSKVLKDEIATILIILACAAFSFEASGFRGWSNNKLRYFICMFLALFAVMGCCNYSSNML